MSAQLLHQLLNNERTDATLNYIPIKLGLAYKSLKEGDWVCKETSSGRMYGQFQGMTKHKTPKAKVLMFQYDYNGNEKVNPHFLGGKYTDFLEIRHNFEQDDTFKIGSYKWKVELEWK